MSDSIGDAETSGRFSCLDGETVEMPDSLDDICHGGGGVKPERLQKILSAHGIASRREAERMIIAGRVTVDGVPATLGQTATPSVDDIAVDGVPLAPRSGSIYIMLNKPRGYVTTMSDEQGRKNVTELVSGIGARVYPIGRLDINSEGLLLLTNDGVFANAVMHPKFGKAKAYHVHVQGDAAAAASKLAQPMEIDSHMVKAASVKLLSSAPDGGLLRIAINEGRNRQVRRMCDKCGLKVLRLKRTAIGDLKLGNLPTGKWRHLTEAEVGLLSLNTSY